MHQVSMNSSLGYPRILEYPRVSLNTLEYPRKNTLEELEWILGKSREIKRGKILSI